MLPLGLSHAEMNAFRDALTSQHRIDIGIVVMTLEHDPIAHIGGALIDGQVNGDASAQATRMATLSLFDPDGALPIDSDSPADGALFLDRMIRIHYDVKVVGSDPVRVNVFTGPITKLDRSGSSVNVEASGKEILAQAASFEPHTIKKGTPRIDAIERIMRWAGETKFSFPDASNYGSLNESVSIARDDILWDAAKRISRSMNLQLFYDGDGTCRLRKHPGNVLWAFRDGPGGSIITDPEVTYGSDGVVNAVIVRGGEKKTAKKKDGQPDTADPKKEKPPKVRYTAVAQRSHPLSPWRLGRQGSDGVVRPRYLLQVVNNSKIRSKAKAREIGERVLDHGLMQGTSATFDSLPVPHLDLGDPCRAVTDAVNVRFLLDQFSLPLSAGEQMTVGYQRNVSPRRRKRRRRHSHGILPVVRPR